MVRLAISGACGKMGSRIIALAKLSGDFKIAVCLERKGHPDIGKELENVKITDDPNRITDADVMIEFTSPEATIEHVEYAFRYRKPIVIGTTGLSEEQKRQIREFSKKIPVVFSPNMSIGVNLFFKLVQEAASKLKGYAVNMSEAHHVHKKDAPSGTAKRLAEIVKEHSGTEVKNIKSIREGEIVGDHEVVFEGDFDTIKLSHSAKTRDIFVQGALEAARWLVNKKSGLYDLQDVLTK